MQVAILCPDINDPAGGIKTLYRHADILNKNGIEAHILHHQRGFRCSWFENKTKIKYWTDFENIKSGRENIYVVVPEIYGGESLPYLKGYKKIIFSQSWCYTFQDYPFGVRFENTMYGDPDLVAIIASSEHIVEYLGLAFPKLKVQRIHISINPAHFSYQPDKRMQISFMPRRNPEDAKQVLNILEFRGALSSFRVVRIHGHQEREVANILKESLIFLSLGYPEGFSLPPAEAMACGAIVIGYHGFGGREFMRPDLCFPVEAGDIITFVRNVEDVIVRWRRDRNSFHRLTQAASEHILSKYSPQREESDLISFWNTIGGL